MIEKLLLWKLNVNDWNVIVTVELPFDMKRNFNNSKREKENPKKRIRMFNWIFNVRENVNDFYNLKIAAIPYQISQPWKYIFESSWKMLSMPIIYYANKGAIKKSISNFGEFYISNEQKGLEV